MKNIYLIPTDKESRLWRDLDSKKLTFTNLSKPNSNECTKCSNEYMYITSKDEIKVGSIVKIPCGVGVVKELHWKYGNEKPSYIVEDLIVSELRYGQKEGELQINSFRSDDCKLIVMTTDPLLIKDGVQEIDDDFLEWFVKNPSCEYVDLLGLRKEKGYEFLGYEIIIPKE